MEKNDYKKICAVCIMNFFEARSHNYEGGKTMKATKLLAVLMTLVMLCTMAPLSLAEEMEIVSISAETYVGEFGRMVESFEITFAEGTDLTAFDKSNIAIENNRTHPDIPWFADGATRVFTHDNYMIIDVDPFLLKLGFVVSCIKNGNVKFSFTFDDLTDISTEVADEFDLYHTDILTYRLFTPESDEPLPVVIWFHGGGEIGDDGVAPLCDYRGAICWAEPEYQAKNPCVVLVPQLPQGKNWYSNPETLDDIRAQVDQLIADGIVDASRVYVAGFSYFQGALWFTTKNLDLVAACLHLLYWHMFDPDNRVGDEWGGIGWEAIAEAQLPVWSCGASGDPTGATTEMLQYHIPYMEANNPNFHYSIWTDADMYAYGMFGSKLHHGWVPAINNQEIIDWLFAQSK